MIIDTAAANAFLRVRGTAPDESTRRFNLTLASPLALQYLIGVLTLISRVPVSLGVADQAMAAVIVALWVAWVHHVRNHGLSAVNR